MLSFSPKTDAKFFVPKRMLRFLSQNGCQVFTILSVVVVFVVVDVVVVVVVFVVVV